MDLTEQIKKKVIHTNIPRYMNKYTINVKPVSQKIII